MSMNPTNGEKMSLAEAVYNAFALVQGGGNVDDARARLRNLREDHGDVAFEAAKVKALVALARGDR